jgi:beta-glucosidase
LGRIVLAAVLVAPLGVASSAAAPATVLADECAWMDNSLSPDERARRLLEASTLDQKLRWLNEQAANNPTQTVFSIGGGQTVVMPVQVPVPRSSSTRMGPPRSPGAAPASPRFRARRP